MTNGWHIVAGYDVYVENDRILRGRKYDYNGEPLTSYPYVSYKYDGYTSCVGVKVNTFRAGKGRYTMK